MDRTDRQIQLEKELIAEKRRLKKDEVILKSTIVITTALLLILIVSTVFIYFELQDQSKVSANTAVQDEVANITPEAISEPERMEAMSPGNYQEPLVTTSSIKEHFISFGSGSSSSIDWMDVGGLQTSVDLSGYGDIKEIRFEASVQDPAENQIVWVRVYNKTDKHPVWNSEVSKSAGAEGYLVSDPIIFDTGNKTYSIQVKTQLGSTISLGEARLHIMLN